MQQKGLLVLIILSCATGTLRFPLLILLLKLVKCISFKLLIYLVLSFRIG